MREIKLKAWDKRRKQIYNVISVQWTYGDLLRKYHKSVPDGEWVPEEVTILLNSGRARTYSYYPSKQMYLRPPREGMRKSVYRYAIRDLHNLVLLEYTGLNDDSGVEIYEGDIVSLQYGAHETPATLEVRYCLEPDFVGFNLLYDPTIRYGVIGNIYENPELLEA